ncbi:hypothetical protein N0V85_005898 [Neurospora sp. IMI 360204]|nr:hypothetical protein N0V85_005898 [Neurospora sp. IMI 360204]
MAGRMRYQVRRLALPSSSTKHHSGCEARTYTCTATTTYTDADYGYGWYQFGRMPPQMVQPQFITLRAGSAKSSVVSSVSTSTASNARDTMTRSKDATTIRDTSRSGLFWDSAGLDIEPRWARQPDIDAIAQVVRRHLGITSPSQCVVTFHSSGTYNKLYHIHSPVHGRYLMRVILPVDPHNKTRGEVATLQLVRRKTDIPVPVVVAYDDTSDNEIGFEWILMKLLEGKPAHLRWRKMNMRQKERLVGRMAEFQAQLSRCGNMTESAFRGIGTLGATSRGESDYVDLMMPEPGPMVSPVFFTGERWHYPVSRGPFQSSHDWLRSYLNVIIKEHSATLAQPLVGDDTDREKRESAEGVTRVARKLTRLLHKLFPQLVHPPERTVLWHGDSLSLDNILVDDNGRITGVVDWECVSTMPRWVSTQFPEFLRGGVEREEEPHRSRYADVFSDEEASEGQDGDGVEDVPDNEGKTELYWIHLMEYEQTQLRRVYSARMSQLMGHGWDGEVEEAALKVDFLGAVAKCAQGFYLKRIEQWVDAVEGKEFVRLGDVLRGGVAGRKDSNASTASGAGVGTGTAWTDTRTTPGKTTIKTTATLSPKRGSESQRPRFSITKIY